MAFVYHPVLHRRVADGRSWGDILAWITGGYVVDSQHWLHGPNVVQRPIPESTTQPTIAPRNAILHTNAGSRSASSLWSWITQSTVTGEPHFQVGYKVMEQYMPLNRRADCNYSANRWFDPRAGKYYGAISFETQDNGALTLNTTPWSFEQVAHMANALTAIAVCYGVYCTAPATWDGSGIGHHTLFPYQGVGSKAWTNVRGKTCPGTARIRQMDYVRQEVANRLGLFIQATTPTSGVGGFRCGQVAA
jgi:hypothetical protein